MSTQPEQFEAAPVSRGSLWFGFVAAALAWLAHGFLCVVISTSACLGGAYQWTWIPANGLRILLGLITLALLIVALAAGAVSFWNWRRLAAPPRPEGRRQNPADQPDLLHAEGRRRAEFMALGGVFVSTVFVLGILWAGLPLILIDICRSAR
jgi:hypothetical protein